MVELEVDSLQQAQLVAERLGLQLAAWQQVVKQVEELLLGLVIMGELIKLVELGEREG